MKEKGSFTEAIEMAKKMTENYAVIYKGRNKLEKECIQKGYIIKRLGEIYPNIEENKKNKLGIFGLNIPIIKSKKHKNNFVWVR